MIRIYGFPLGPYDGFSFFIFLFFKSKNPSAELINHERIHFYQQVELLFIFHWLLYAGHYAVLRLKMLGKPGIKRPHDTAYRAICFEKEAYANERNLTYLDNRPLFAWRHYFHSRRNQSVDK
ncbi:hypothetical protein [Fulvivirga sedimenti]|uniref:Uncharacterized protein n=1 Tax=Fulvivirga sedimenti TaxID=2879465 RepID=A0A9X1HPH1_9BACT|nr:hypothetical protein [Fulvivirga sedimenti]MCA6073934.1 hypothetical protein [Fulvivirga sedimenti]